VASLCCRPGTGISLLFAFLSLLPISPESGASLSPPLGMIVREPMPLNTNAAADSGEDYQPRLVTDGAGNWIAVWYSNNPVGGTGGDRDILFARSTDFCSTWTDPAPLNTNATGDSGADEMAAVTTDGVGTWIAVWQSTDTLGNKIGTDQDILFARSTDNGGTWTAPATLNNNADSDSGNDNNPRVTTDRNGNWIVVWQSGEDLGGVLGSEFDILCARSTDNGVTWTGPAPLNTNASSDNGDDLSPQLTTDGLGNWIAVWHTWDDLGGAIGLDYDILFARSTDVGETWSVAGPLNTSATHDSGADSNPVVATDGAGRWIAVWESDDSLGLSLGADADIVMALSEDNGQTWSAPSPLNSATTDVEWDVTPQVATDGAGNWYAVWSSDETFGGEIGRDLDILFARSTDNGETWSAPALANINAPLDTGHDYKPELATDGQGNWIVVWYSEDALGGTIGNDRDILLARMRILPVYSDPSPLTDYSYPELIIIDYLNPDLATDSNGTWILLWNSEHTLDGRIGSDQDILIRRSTDNGYTWSSASELSTNATTDTQSDVKPAATTDGSGTWIAVWESLDSLEDTIGEDRDILFTRSTDNGRGWSGVAPLNINAATDDGGDMNAHVTTDGHGHWIVVWESSSEELGGRSGGEHAIDMDIAFARSNDNGLTWTTPEALNTNAYIDQRNDNWPKVVTDGEGTWIAVWYCEWTFGGVTQDDFDILFSRSEDDGETWSEPSPLDINAASDSLEDIRPSLSTDGEGNWVAAWRALWPIIDDEDVLTSRSIDSGATWSSPRLLSRTFETDHYGARSQEVVTDGLGNWIITWDSQNDLGESIGSDEDVLLALSSDQGLTWTSPIALNANADRDPDYYNDEWPTIGTDGAGTWMAAWDSSHSEDIGGALAPIRNILFASYRPALAKSHPAAATNVETRKITWTWTDCSNCENGYKIWCASGTTTAGVEPMTLPADVIEWSTGDLSVNSQHTFSVAPYIQAVGVAPRASCTTWTLAETPVAPQVHNPTATTLNVTLVPTDGNPPHTEYALYCPTIGRFLKPAGLPVDTPYWHPAAEWSNVTVSGLLSDTTYEFQFMARNGAGIETPLGPIGSGRTFLSIGSLSVVITPGKAVDAGAQWRRVGTITWFDSGTAESDIPSGTHTVEFKDVTDWSKPADEDVLIRAGETTTLTAVYLNAEAKELLDYLAGRGGDPSGLDYNGDGRIDIADFVALLASLE
jgi:Neuraminidase (sialidase)